MSVTVNGTSGLVFGDGTIQGTAGAMPFRNRIINGDFRVDQRSSGTQTPAAGAFPFIADKWQIYHTTDGGYSGQVVADAPSGSGLVNSAKITVTTADTSITTTQYASLQTKIEGNLVSDLDFGKATAKQFTISFWAKSSIVGTYSVIFSNNSYNRGYAAEYTISAANTWEYKTITATADTGGSWLSDTGMGLRVNFALASGPTYNVAAGSWLGQTVTGSTNQTNLLQTVGATLQITGVQLEKAAAATSFEVRPIGVETLLCQRYFFNQAYAQTQSWGYGHSQTTNLGRVSVVMPVRMRASPTVTSTATMVANWAGYNGTTTVSGGSTMSNLTVIDMTGSHVVVEFNATGIQGVCIPYGYAGVTSFNADF